MWTRVRITQRKLKKGVTYCLRWPVGAGRTRTEAVGPDRKLAERRCAEREVELNSSTYREPKPISFADFVSEELDMMAGRITKRSLADLRETLKRFHRDTGVVALTDVTPSVVERFFSRRIEHVATATANKDLRTLKASLARGVRRGYLAANPAATLRQVREPQKQVRVLSPDELSKLLSACPDVWWQTLIAFATSTGLRRGELLALRWQDVDLDTHTLWVRNTERHATKSKRDRAVGLPDGICNLLRGFKRNGPLVFQRNGNAAVAGSVSRGFRQIADKAGIPHCTLHDLRRTFVSQLAMAGVNAAVVQQLAGHASISTTVRYYTGIMPDVLRDARDRLPFDKVIADVSNTSREHTDAK